MHPYISKLYCFLFSAAILKTFKVIEFDVAQNIATDLKYAQDRNGWGGRGRDAGEYSE